MNPIISYFHNLIDLYKNINIGTICANDVNSNIDTYKTPPEVHHGTAGNGRVYRRSVQGTGVQGSTGVQAEYIGRRQVGRRAA